MLLEEKILARLSLHGFFNSKIADDKCLCPSIFQETKHVNQEFNNGYSRYFTGSYR